MALLSRKMEYALRDGNPVHISEVERGLACGCVCPVCGEPLIAKKGTKMMHHFSHVSGSECEHGYETSLHIAAKTILSKAQRIVLPTVYAEFETPTSYCTRHITDGPVELHIDRVELEKRVDSIAPDIIVYSKNRPLLVEIFVTHKADDVKISKIKKLGLSAIEIDLHRINSSSKCLEDILVGNVQNKRWLNNEYANRYVLRLLAIVEKKPIIRRRLDDGSVLHVENCPKRVRVWNGKPYANYINDCRDCEYNIGQDGERILCAGKVRLKNDDT